MTMQFGFSFTGTGSQGVFRLYLFCEPQRQYSPDSPILMAAVCPFLMNPKRVDFFSVCSSFFSLLEQSINLPTPYMWNQKLEVLMLVQKFTVCKTPMQQTSRWPASLHLQSFKEIFLKRHFCVNEIKKEEGGLKLFGGEQVS